MAGANRVDASQRAVLMQRREGAKRTDMRFNLGIDPHRTRVPRSAVNHAVPDGIGLRQASERLPHRTPVNPAIRHLQIMAPENRQAAIEHSQPQRTRPRIHDQNTQTSNDTRPHAGPKHGTFPPGPRGIPDGAGGNRWLGTEPNQPARASSHRKEDMTMATISIPQLETAETAPSTYRAAVVHEFGSPLTVEQVAMRELASGQIRVKVEACGLCHTATTASQVGNPTSIPPAGTGMNGGAGLIGPGHEGGRPGDTLPRAVVRRRTSRARRVRRIRRGVQAVKVAGTRSSDFVAVFGVGGLGHLAIQYAAIAGGRVVAVDVVEEKLELARELGAEFTINASQQDPVEAIQQLRGVDQAVALAVSHGNLSRPIRRCAAAARFVRRAAGRQRGQAADFRDGAQRHHNRGLHRRHTKGSREVFELHAAGKTRVIRETRPLHQVNQAIADVTAGRVAARIVLEP